MPIEKQEMTERIEAAIAAAAGEVAVKIVRIDRIRGRVLLVWQDGREQWVGCPSTLLIQVKATVEPSVVPLGKK